MMLKSDLEKFALLEATIVFHQALRLNAVREQNGKPYRTAFSLAREILGAAFDDRTADYVVDYVAVRIGFDGISCREITEDYLRSLIANSKL